MRGEARKSLRRCFCQIMVAAAGITLLFPGSVSVLCIAPGGHVAVEDINAACCARSPLTFQGRSQQVDGLAAPGGCQNCTDVFLAQSTRGAIPQSHYTVAPDSPADSYSKYHLPSDALFSSRRSLSIAGIVTRFAAAMSVPLRC